MKKFFSYAVVFVLGIVMSMVGLRAMTGHSVLNLTSESRAKEAVLASLETKPLPLHRAGNDSVVADAAAKLEPAIVDVHTVGKAIQTQSPFDGFGDDPIFRHLFRGGGETVQPKGAGSGVIISPAGYILTNNHVVADTETVTVTVGDKGYTAKVIGTDPTTDIAVVKIDPKGATLPVAELGDSDAIRVGDWAIAIGNPLDVGTTVTLGIISALNRTHLHAEGHSLNSVIQTDAAINPGNSGGALANINGQVIGINEAIMSPTGGSVGIGFAIPINSAKKIAAELIKNGKIVRPYLGIGFGPLKALPEQARQQLGITSKSDDGAIVTQVYPGSPAEQAGLQRYDVVLEANRQKITDPDMLKTLIQKLKVGDTLTLLISRDGQNTIKVVTLREQPADFGQQRQQPMQPQLQQQDPQQFP